jgi:hypothetical protein
MQFYGTPLNTSIKKHIKYMIILAKIMIGGSA